MEDALPVFDLAPLVRLLVATRDRGIEGAAAAAGGAEATPDDPLSPAALDADRDIAALCAGVASCLARTSCLLVRDPRVSPQANGDFLDALEAYFARSDAEKRADRRPELHHQVGHTPAGVETPRCVADPASCAVALAAQRPGHEAVVPTKADLKERFFWRLGPRPASTDFPELNAAQVVPRGCEDWWPGLLDGWGGALLATTEAVAVAAAHGLRLEGGPRCLVHLMRGGPHLLAPTGSDLSDEGGAAEGDTLAGFHQDLNLLTIHGQARFPGLRVWLRGGRRLAVRVPDGCLLLQAGQQLERLTGGRVRAGWHEVVATREALAMARERLRVGGGGDKGGGGDEDKGGDGGRPGRGAAAGERNGNAAAWRVSSTVFAHVASDAWLRPLLSYAEATASASASAASAGGEGRGEQQQQEQQDEEQEEDEEAWRRRYAPVKAGAQVQAELEAIKLAAVK